MSGLKSICVSALTVVLVASAVGAFSHADETPVTPEIIAAPASKSRGPSQEYVDLDAYSDSVVSANISDRAAWGSDPWTAQILPDGLIYDNYLAGTKESRLSWLYNYVEGDNEVFDATVGARVGLFRYGDRSPIHPEGFQIDAEGSAQLRLDPEQNVDLRSTDFRGGLPITYGTGRSRWKFGYYHLSSHLGDEFLLKNPGYPRLNYSRDVLLLGYAYYLKPETRIYAEAGWAFYSDVGEPWEFQVGIDHAPIGPTGYYGAPFWAINGYLREEIDYGGGLTAQAGWAWRSDFGSSLLRAGVQYYNGPSNHYSFYNEHEKQLGLGLWYDF